jgi:DNA/RNA endonuclease YhcR with UshA esterase domain
MKNYNKVSFEELLKNPDTYDGQAIAVSGIYSGYKNVGPVIFETAEDFRLLKYKSSIHIFNQRGADVFVNVKHGACALVQGVFKAAKKDEVNIFFAEIVDVQSVTGAGKLKKNPKRSEKSKKENSKEAKPKESG